jgi:hypothetical protein
VHVYLRDDVRTKGTFIYYPIVYYLLNHPTTHHRVTCYLFSLTLLTDYSVRTPKPTHTRYDDKCTANVDFHACNSTTVFTSFTSFFKESLCSALCIIIHNNILLYFYPVWITSVAPEI